MPTANKQDSQHKSTLLTGVSGVGKSTIAYHAPQPIAALLLDKSSIDVPPGIDGSGIYYKTFPPAQIDLSKDDHGRARNIADTLIADIQLFRDHFMTKKPLKMKLFDGTLEEWPTPKTVVIEGGDFLAQHMLNLICARHKKANPSDFENRFEAWGLRLVELHAIYDQLTYLPCNVIVTTGIHKVTNSKGEETGEIMPELGGKFNEEGPRKFQSSLLVYAENGKHYVRTRSNAKYKGFKLGGKFGEQETVEITIHKDKPVNLFQKLFS